ncbi:hypothetical protein T4C_8670 [Trichinella pseudospiralis]|uniref:Uncharacterized protein n=1 Tax=Trichinella pseudospiralis TaxID=6337 RepID=A0A0V1JND6_TRIPS|nr:hypothetical protein T4C_8670 [Trichinella pseudospiralis]
MLMNPEGYSYIRCSSNKNGLQIFMSDAGDKQYEVLENGNWSYDSGNLKVNNRCKYTEHCFKKCL